MIQEGCGLQEATGIVLHPALLDDPCASCALLAALAQLWLWWGHWWSLVVLSSGGRQGVSRQLGVTGEQQGHPEGGDSFLQPSRRVKIPTALIPLQPQPHGEWLCPWRSGQGAVTVSQCHVTVIRAQGRAGLFQGKSPSLPLWERPGATPGGDSEAEHGDTRVLQPFLIPVCALPQVRGGTSAMTCWWLLTPSPTPCPRW